jgi:hypothetical protein
VDDPAAPNSSPRRRRPRRSRFNKAALHKWAKDDDVPEGDPRDESNLGLVVAVAVGLVLVLLVTYIAGQMQYEAPF